MRIKYFLEKIFAILLFFILLIPFSIACLMSFIFIGSPIIFIQERVGKDEKLFFIYKLRTMKNSSSKLEINKWGNILRRFKIDEIPQLLNILKGDMSFVGPRPLLPEYLNIYTDFERKRHHVRPGLTGLVQINGGNNLSWKRKFELDIKYINQASFLFDLKILLMTVIKFFSGSLQDERNTVAKKYTGE